MTDPNRTPTPTPNPNPNPNHTPTPNPTPTQKPKRQMSDARISGMVATGVLVALVFFVTWFVLAAG